jgi:hypothetical protein
MPKNIKKQANIINSKLTTSNHQMGSSDKAIAPSSLGKDDINISTVETMTNQQLEQQQQQQPQGQQQQQQPVESAEQMKLQQHDLVAGDRDNESVASGDCIGSGAIQNGTPKSGIARKETTLVSRYRIYVVICILLCTAVVSVGAYTLTRKYETSKGSEQFTDDSSKILQSIGTNVIETFAVLDSFATNIVSHANSNVNNNNNSVYGSSFPFVNIPDYGNRVAKIQSTTNTALAIWLFFLVTPEQRESYEQFAWDTKRTLVNHTLELQSIDPGYYGTVSLDAQFNNSIHSDYDAIPYNVHIRRAVLLFNPRYMLFNRNA